MDILGVTISLSDLLVWAVFGLVVGFIVHIIDRGEVKGGILGTAILGILGAIVGGYLAGFLFGRTVDAFSIPGLITAVVGGLILAFLYRLLFRSNEHIKTTRTTFR